MASSNQLQPLPEGSSSKHSVIDEIHNSDHQDIEYVVVDDHQKSELPICGRNKKPWFKMVNWDEWRQRFTGGVEKTRVYHVWPGKNVFFFGGRLICGPDPRGFLITTISIILSSWIFCVYIGDDDIWNHSTLILTFCVILTLLVMFNLIMVSTTDPGIIPRNQQSPSLEEIGTSEDGVVMLKSKNTISIINGIEVKLKYCKICKIYRPPRSCHCAICDNCVEKFDHHCPWIGQCIGLRNYRFFLTFISSSLVFFIYIFVFSCRRINQKMSETRSSSSSSGLFTSLRNCPETLALASFSLVAMWFLGGLVSFHIYLIMLNQTAYENFRGRQRRNYMNSAPNSNSNPYDKGILSNIKEVCFVGLPPSAKVNFRAETTLNIGRQQQQQQQQGLI